MEKILNSYKGVVLYFVIVIILSLLFTYRISNLNIARNINNNVTVEVEREYA